MPTVPVTIYIKRGKGGPEGSVAPWVVKLKKKDKDDVEWKLVSQYDGASADIKEKSAGDWPFDTTPPKKIEKTPKKSGKIKDSAREETYQYAVRCSFTDGTPPIEIDPDIIIIGGSLIPDPYAS
jgi:hypothetical protein